MCVCVCVCSLTKSLTKPAMNFPGKSAGVDCHFLLQGIFPTQELNPGLLHCKQTLYRLSHQTRILEWIAVPFSRGSSLPGDRTWVFCIAGRFFTV